MIRKLALAGLIGGAAWAASKYFKATPASNRGVDEYGGNSPGNSATGSNAPYTPHGSKGEPANTGTTQGH